ncbi:MULTISPECIES: GNAT family N-acetyltransferase [Streptomyces]|uniref:GNAT family N-acetyltransferase n=1 Tax=Streptomyces TaxID=1883 RepID=UPI001E36269B|nr:MULTISPECIES: GNAT family N-acetyltransferase [Streptomyces]UFQ18822.1 GNAT family N-acetyltransferase [Streptomyces huasconensis]WCL88439.1 GNAT family N-acetyltransferase [Streptomyces sp. JCM 35825]
MTPELRSERLLLSAYVAADEPHFVALFQDAAVGRWFGDGVQSAAEDRALFGRIFSLVYAEERFPVWAVRYAGRYVGHAEIKPSPESWLDGHEIVYGLTRESWGLGLGTELAQLLTAYGHETLGLTEVHATVDSENTASLAVLKRLGYTQDRTVPEDNGRTTLLLTSRPAAPPPVGG